MAPHAEDAHKDEENDVEHILLNKDNKDEPDLRIPLIEESETNDCKQKTKFRPTHDAKPSSAIVVVWLIFWLSNNVALTLLNKATFSTFDFRYPYFLSCVHMLVNYVGAETCFLISKYCGSTSSVNGGGGAGDGLLLGGLTRHVTSRRESFILLAYSLVYSLNIAMGNVSLRHVSINFNQMFRSLAPAVTIFFSFLFGRSTSTAKKLAVLPVMLGVALACKGDVEYTKLGLIYTSSAVMLAAIKGVAAGEILTGSLKLHPIDLLSKLSPLASIQCFILSILTGELSSIKSRWLKELSPAVNKMPLIALLSTGLLAFSLNISSLTCTKLTSPLTLSIAGNAKQALMIIMATILFQTPVPLLNGIGLVTVLLGSSLYSYVSILEKERSKFLSSNVSSESIKSTATSDENETNDKHYDAMEMNKNVSKDRDTSKDDKKL